MGSVVSTSFWNMIHPRNKSHDILASTALTLSIVFIICLLKDPQLYERAILNHCGVNTH